MVQPVHRPMTPSGAFLISQVLDMQWVLHLLAAIVASRMHSDDGIGIEDAHGIGGGPDLKRAAHVGVRDRVVIPVEARVRRFMHPMNGT